MRRADFIRLTIDAKVYHTGTLRIFSVDSCWTDPEARISEEDFDEDSVQATAIDNNDATELLLKNCDMYELVGERAPIAVRLSLLEYQMKQLLPYFPLPR